MLRTKNPFTFWLKRLKEARQTTAPETKNESQRTHSSAEATIEIGSAGERKARLRMTADMPPSAVTLLRKRASRSVTERTKMGKITLRKSERRRKVQAYTRAQPETAAATKSHLVLQSKTIHELMQGSRGFP